MGLFNKFVVLLKKRFLYKPDAERVDIRLLSVPDWLYKITTKDSKDLSFLCKESYSKLEEIFNDLGTYVEKVNIKKVISNSVSQYKKNLVDNNKLVYLEKMNVFLNLSDDKLNTIEDYRDFFTKLSVGFINLKKTIHKSSKILEEYYSSEIAEANACFDRVSDLLIEFTDIFSSTNDSKVNSIVKLVKEIETKSVNRITMDKKIELLDKDLSKIRNHVYKLSDKLILLRQSPRFRDVLEKEGKLGQFLESKDDLFASAEKRFAPIEVVLYAYADKVRESELAKEYVVHFAQAIYHDLDLDILGLLRGLDSDLNNKRTKIRKSVGDIKSEQLSYEIKWLIEKLPEFKAELKSLDESIKNSRAAVRTYIIFNEIEDTESRIEFYQKKLLEQLSDRKDQIIQIENLNLIALKEKLRKELLLVSGYDVQVVYDEI